MGRLPRGLVCLVLALTLLSGRVAAARPRIHTVYAGQRLGTIAKRYNISADALCHANRIEGCKLIHPGQRLIIPERSDADGSAALRLLDSGYSGDGKKAEDPATDQNARLLPSPVEPPSRPSNQASGEDEKPRKHKIYAGQRLGSIAKRYNISVDALCNANGVSPDSPIRPGQELVIPDSSDKDGSVARRLAGHDEGTEKPERSAKPAPLPEPRRARRRAAPSWMAYSKKPWRRGYVHIIGHHASWKGYLVGRGGRVLPASRRAVSLVLAWPYHNKLMSSELLERLAKVSDQFGGRPLRAVSGYRTRSYARESKHKMGRAVDFSVVGVPNDALRDYLRTFGNVGLGYYPNSTFVHFDVRESPVYWIDDSGPGEAPRYRHLSAQSTPEARSETQPEAPRAE